MFALFTFFLCTFGAPYEDPWADILRDAQVTNQAKLAQGRALMELDYLPGSEAQHIIVNADISWTSDGKYFLRFDIWDPENKLLGINDETLRKSKPGPSYLLHDGSSVFAYSSFHRLMHIQDPRTFTVSPFLALNPKTLWYNCCPPNTEGGRPWFELIGEHPAQKGFIRATYEYLKLDNDRIKQVRRDQNGGTLEVTFSMQKAGNITEVHYDGKEGLRPSISGNYSWVEQDGSYRLDNFVFRIDNKNSKQRFDQLMKLNVIKYSNHPVPPVYFTKAHLLTLLPSDTKVSDKVTKRVYIVKPSKLIGDDALRDAIRLLRSESGFLRKQ